MSPVTAGVVNVTATNWNKESLHARPVFDWVPLAPVGSGPIFVGGFPELSKNGVCALADSSNWFEMLEAFRTVGVAGSFGNFTGLFEIVTSATIDESDSLVGKPVYVLIGNSDQPNDPASASGWIVVRTDAVFDSNADIEIDLNTIESEQVLSGYFEPNLYKVFQPDIGNAFPGLGFPSLESDRNGCEQSEVPPISTTSVAVAEEHTFADVVIGAWTEPNLSGASGLMGFERSFDLSSLVPTMPSLGFDHRWYLVEPDTIIDASFVRTATPIIDAIDGSQGAIIPIGESLFGIWLDADGDFEPGDGDRFSWALIDFGELAVAILASGMSSAPDGIIAGRLETLPISTTSVEVVGRENIDLTINAWNEPNLSGGGGGLVFGRQSDDLSLVPIGSSLGGEHRWYLVEQDTIIDASFVRTAKPIYGAVDGSLSTKIPIGESLLGIWLDTDFDFEPGQGDRFGWALVDVSESAVAILASGMSSAPLESLRASWRFHPFPRQVWKSLKMADSLRK
ncbi:MAG: hypothetical protein R3F19_17615 [Verrucomicrobiales bacterium]